MTETARDMAADAADRAQETFYTTLEDARRNPVPLALLGAGAVWMIVRAIIDSRSGTRGGPSWLETLRSNPIPTTIAAASLGYLVVRRIGAYEDEFESAVETSSGVARRASGLTSAAASKAAGAMKGAGRQARERLGTVGTRVQETFASASHRTATRFDRWMQENPLAVGAAALALGAAIGLTAPSTETEDQVMGDARDRLVDMAQEAAHRAAERVQAVANDAVNKVEQSSGESAGSPPTSEPQSGADTTVSPGF